jgi:uncharacterized cupredoxin-like copper-binding protein
MSRKAFVIAGLVFVVAVVVVPVAAARGRVVRATVVTVTMKEYKFGFSAKSARAGKITFKLVNKGKLAHDIRLAGRTSALVQPGMVGKLVVTLKKGKYPYKCTLPGHAALGMKGTFTVT